MFLHLRCPSTNNSNTDTIYSVHLKPSWYVWRIAQWWSTDTEHLVSVSSRQESHLHPSLRCQFEHRTRQQSSAWILQGRPQAAAGKKPGCGGLWARQDVSLHLVTTGLMYSGKSRGSEGFQTLEDTFSFFRSPQPIWKELLDTTNFFQILIVLWLNSFLYICDL